MEPSMKCPSMPLESAFLPFIFFENYLKYAEDPSKNSVKELTILWPYTSVVYIKFQIPRQQNMSGDAKVKIHIIFKLCYSFATEYQNNIFMMSTLMWKLQFIFKN